MGVSVLLADDHRLFTLGIERVLEKHPEFQWIGTVGNGKEVLLFLEKNQQVDVLVLDLNMPLMCGMEVLSHLSTNYPGLKKLVLSSEHTPTTVEACKTLGANGFIGKDSCFDSFREALDKVAWGGEYFQSVGGSGGSIGGLGNCPFQKLKSEFGLSEREAEITRLIMQQLETKQIADQLQLSPLTVKTHRKNIFSKLKVHNVAGLMGLLKV